MNRINGFNVGEFLLPDFAFRFDYLLLYFICKDVPLEFVILVIICAFCFGLLWFGIEVGL